MKNLTGKDKPFHSSLDKAAALLKRKVGTGAEFMQELKGLGGIKEAEMADRKLAEMSGMPKMTHEQFMGELANRPVPAIGEKVLGGDRREKGSEAPYHSEYTLPGGENYREMLIKAPKSEKYWAQKYGGEKKFFDDPDAASRHAGSSGQAGRVEGSEGGFGGVGAHFGGEPSILASMRLKDRTGPNGEKLLHLEELQSDWHQQGRDKGYKEAQGTDGWTVKSPNPYEPSEVIVYDQNGKAVWSGTNNFGTDRQIIDKVSGRLQEDKVPDAPFKKNWEEMALKRLVHHAAEKGYHGIVVTPGKEQADRYSLAKHIDDLHYSGSNLVAYDPEGKEVIKRTGVRPQDLPELVGKELADKLMAQEPSGTLRSLRGVDLQVGGEGMKGFYDKKVPNILNAIGKKHGVKTQLGGHTLQGRGKERTADEFMQAINDAGHDVRNLTLAQQREFDYEPKPTPVHHFPITEDMRKDILTNGLPLYKEGGNVKATSTEDMKRELSDKYKPTATKASEALGKHEGKHLKVTQADRTKVGGGFLGGPGFSSLQHVDPNYEGAAWGVNSSGAASKIINANAQHPEGDVLWSAMIGAPNQHSSNQMVFDMLLKQFKAAIKAGKMTPELRALFNAKLEAAADNEGKPIFDKGADIAGKNFFKNLNTFDRRRAAADLMGGNTIGGKKGQIFDYEKTMRETTEPELLDAPTHAIGPRLFGLTGQRSLQPNLHPAFPHILHGEDTGQMYHPVPREIMLPDFHKQIQESKGRKVGFMDLTRNTPSQHLNEAFLTHLQKHGYAEGGQVQPTIPQMRQSLQANGKPFGDMSSIGAQEAPNMQVKSYVPPVAGQTGQMPVGGVDMSQGQAGQQLLPASMMQPNPQGRPQGQPAPAGAPSPMGAPPAGGSNILQMTPQGQAMAAMQPQQGALPKMADGGGVTGNGSLNVTIPLNAGGAGGAFAQAGQEANSGVTSLGGLINQGSAGPSSPSQQGGTNGTSAPFSPSFFGGNGQNTVTDSSNPFASQRYLADNNNTAVAGQDMSNPPTAATATSAGGMSPPSFEDWQRVNNETYSTLQSNPISNQASSNRQVPQVPMAQQQQQYQDFLKQYNQSTQGMSPQQLQTLSAAAKGGSIRKKQPSIEVMRKAIGGGVTSLGSVMHDAMGGPVPTQKLPFQSAGDRPMPFIMKDGGSGNTPMNNNYSDNGATDFSVDNIQQLAKGGKVVSLEVMQKELKSMKHQVSKLKDNLDTMRLALTRNSKKAK
jgi:hypothetical protein